MSVYGTRGDQTMASELVELERAVNPMFWEMNLGEKQVLSQALSHLSSPLVVLVCGSVCLFRDSPSQYTPHCPGTNLDIWAILLLCPEKL